jgi:hypothetical protein
MTSNLATLVLRTRSAKDGLGASVIFPPQWIFNEIQQTKMTLLFVEASAEFFFYPDQLFAALDGCYRYFQSPPLPASEVIDVSGAFALLAGSGSTLANFGFQLTIPSNNQDFQKTGFARSAAVPTTIDPKDVKTVVFLGREVQVSW